MRAEISIFHEIDLILIALDPEGRFLSLNPAAERLFQKNEEDLVGEDFYTVLDEYSRAKAGQMIAQTLENGSVVDWELDHSQAGAEPVLVGYTTCLLWDEGQHVLGIGALGRNLSANLELTAQLAAANQKLEGALRELEKTQAALKSNQAQLLQSEKMRALGQMVAGVAHEINNPLGFARNNLIYLGEKMPVLRELFKRYASLEGALAPENLQSIRLAKKRAGIDALWDDLRDSIQEGLAGIDRIRDIVLSLRSFSRLDEAGLKEADLNEGLRSTIRLLKPICEARVQIEETYGDVPKVLCNPGELNQVFLNLLTNSIQAIEGAGRISVETSTGPGGVRIRVADTGKGMDAEILTKLGEPFFTTQPVGAGVGLGLAVSFGILQRQNAKIHFESQPGTGTVATIELPIVP